MSFDFSSALNNDCQILIISSSKINSNIFFLNSLIYKVPTNIYDKNAKVVEFISDSLFFLSGNLWHFFVRVPDRPNFTTFPYILCVPMALRKDLYPILVFDFD